MLKSYTFEINTFQNKRLKYPLPSLSSGRVEILFASQPSSGNTRRSTSLTS